MELKQQILLALRATIIITILVSIPFILGILLGYEIFAFAVIGTLILSPFLGLLIDIFISKFWKV